MQFLRGNIDDFEVEKDHFQKSDIFAMSKRGVLRETTSGCSEKPHRPRDPSDIPQKTMQIPLENVMFSKMVLWLECFYVFELSKQWKFIAF